MINLHPAMPHTPSAYRPAIRNPKLCSATSSHRLSACQLQQHSVPCPSMAAISLCSRLMQLNCLPKSSGECINILKHGSMLIHGERHNCHQQIHTSSHLSCRFSTATKSACIPSQSTANSITTIHRPDALRSISTVLQHHAGMEYIGPLQTNNRSIHVIWASTDQVDWAAVTADWLSLLPADEQESVLAVEGGVSSPNGQTRLLARILQRVAVSAALPHSTQLHSAQEDAINNAHGSMLSHPLDVNSNGSSDCSNNSEVTNGSSNSSSWLCSGSNFGVDDMPDASITHNRIRNLQFARNAHGKPFLIDGHVSCCDRAATHAASSTQAAQYDSTQQQSNGSSSTQRLSNNRQAEHLNGKGASGHSNSGLAGAPNDHSPLQQPCFWAPDLGQRCLAQQPETHHTPPEHRHSKRQKTDNTNIVNLPPIQFNITHTTGIVGVAVAPAGWAVGLDVERKGRVPQQHGIMRLARRRFAPQEAEALQGCPDDVSRAELFSRLWALKESFVKARGSGISAAPGLKGFAVGVTQHTQPLQPASQPYPSTQVNSSLPFTLHSNIVSQQGGQAGRHTQSQPATITLQLLGLSGSSETARTESDSASVSTGQHSNGSGLTESNDTQHPCSCITAGIPCDAAPAYRMLLFEPNQEHVAALCVALPRSEEHLWPVTAATTSNQPCSPPRQSNDQDGISIHMWRFMPGQPLQPLPLCMKTEAKDVNNESLDGVLLACSS